MYKRQGTGKMGCVRMSPGFYTCEDEIDEAVKAVEEMAALYLCKICLLYTSRCV